MSAIAGHCKLLVVLDIKGCWRITDKGVKTVAEYCKGLQILNVFDCRDVNEVTLHRLRQRGVKIDRPPDPLFQRRLAQPIQQPLRMQV